MADFSKAPESKNFEDRTIGGFRGFVDSMQEAFGVGRYDKDMLDAQVIARSILDVTRREPLKERAASTHEALRKKDPSIPEDVDLDAIVDYWIRNADAATRDRVDLSKVGGVNDKPKK